MTLPPTRAAKPRGNQVAAAEEAWRNVIAIARPRIHSYYARLPYGVIERDEFAAAVVAELFLRSADSSAWKAHFLAACRAVSRQHMRTWRHETLMGGAEPPASCSWFEPDDASRLEYDDASRLEYRNRAVEREVARLPHNQRYSVLLSCLYGAPDDLVAEVLACSVGTVRVHRWRGLRSLRRLFSRTPGGGPPASGCRSPGKRYRPLAFS